MFKTNLPFNTGKRCYQTKQRYCNYQNWKQIRSYNSITLKL